MKGKSRPTLLSAGYLRDLESDLCDPEPIDGDYWTEFGKRRDKTTVTPEGTHGLFIVCKKGFCKK